MNPLELRVKISDRTTNKNKQNPTEPNVQNDKAKLDI
jgi:hypothetical protein